MVNLNSNAEPTLSIGKEEFESQVRDGTFWGVPTEYFKVEGGEVKLKSVFASQLDWNLEENVNGILNINAIPQTVVVEGEQYHINPGFCCSLIEETYLK